MVSHLIPKEENRNLPFACVLFGELSWVCVPLGNLLGTDTFHHIVTNCMCYECLTALTGIVELFQGPVSYGFQSCRSEQTLSLNLPFLAYC